VKADESVADRREERRRSACSARVELGPSMCWRGSAGAARLEARPKVIGVEEVELPLCQRRGRLSRPCGQADVVEDGPERSGSGSAAMQRLRAASVPFVSG
jgi:hypothetical protein